MAESVDKHIFKNGMVLLGEPMEAVESVAFGFMLPAGVARLPKGCCGAANVIVDWIFRGAGDKDSRQFSDALDGLGLHRASSVGSSHITVGAALEASNLADALELYSDVILRPALQAEKFELARQLAIDGVKGLDDDPRQKVMLALREQFYPEPLGRSPLGHIEDLEALATEQTAQLVHEHFNVSETIFAVAGKYDFDVVCRQLQGLFGDVAGHAGTKAAVESRPEKYKHFHNDGAQVHIGLMTDTVKLSDEDYYNARVAVSVLSGGMSARLFTEVREKRGLCYAIVARYHALKEAAGIMCYAGTTPDKAQQTIDVIIGEFNKLREGFSEEELQRAKIGLESALILQSESSSSRASGIASDYHMLGRVRSLDEIKERIDATNVNLVMQFLEKNKFEDFTVVSIGPKPVSI